MTYSQHNFDRTFTANQDHDFFYFAIFFSQDRYLTWKDESVRGRVQLWDDWWGLGFGSGNSINATFMILIVTVTHNPSFVLAAQTQNLSLLYFWSGLDVEN